MRGFARSFFAGLGSVTIFGAVLLGLAGSGEPPEGVRAESSPLGQVEDADGAGDDGPPAAPVLTPVEQLLDQLASPSDGTGLPAAQRVLLSRDPFAPVVPDDVAATPGGDGDGDSTDDIPGVDGGSDGGGGTDGDTDGGGSGDGGGSPDNGSNACEGNETETVCDGVVVTLDEVDESGTAVVTVDGTRYTVSLNDEFATSFRVLSISEPCVTLLYGDEAFSICVGATVLK